MFDSEFFPTPKAVIRTMLAPYMEDGRLPAGMAVLDPSAGKGDLLDYVENASNRPRLYAVEQDPNLVHILRGAGYRVLGNDWLTLCPEQRFDFILMNPPFSCGATHLLHTWNVIKSGKIACLLNAETIENPHSSERQLLANIIADNQGVVQNLGSCFRKAERPTDVQVCCVWLEKKDSSTAENKFDFEAEIETQEGDVVVAAGSDLAHADRVGATIRQYHEAMHHFKAYCRAIDGMKFFADGLLADGARSIFDTATSCYGNETSTHARMNRFADEIREQAWTAVIGKLGLDKYLTSDLRDKFHAFLKETGAMALTKENIANVVQHIMMNASSIMDQAVVAVFDEFTRYHEENRCHVEGWKTNSAWKVNRKIILPNWVTFSSSWFSMNYYKDKDYQDIDKVMSYLSGDKVENIKTIQQAMVESWHRMENGRTYNCWTTDWVESTYFRIRYFKKGTVHLYFKSEKLWNDFNIRACAGKNWIGAGK
jgi:hypothetical protein